MAINTKEGSLDHESSREWTKTHPQQDGGLFMHGYLDFKSLIVYGLSDGAALHQAGGGRRLGTLWQLPL